MQMTPDEVWMHRLIAQASSLTFAVAQDLHTRELILLAPTGQVVRHTEVPLLRQWLRQYGQCGRFGRRCFVDDRHVCGCVGALPGLKKGGLR